MAIRNVTPALRLLAVGLILLLANVPGIWADEALPASVFARVDGMEISGDQYLAVLRGRARQKFYHGKAPESERAAFRREVGDTLIAQTLLDKEARRQGIRADEARVNERLSRLARRYASDSRWASDRERILDALRTQLRRLGRIEALEERVRAAPQPTTADLRTYYAQHREKFTTPERIRVSLILLRVAPAAPVSAWQEAEAGAQRIARQIKQGAAFEDMARLHSQDPSADQGGDLGFVHRDMVGASAQDVLDTLPMGAVSGPVQVLEGYAIFRLDAREEATLNPYRAVRERVAALWRREAAAQAWAAFRDGLRDAAVIRINETYFRPGMEKTAVRRVDHNKRP